MRIDLTNATASQVGAEPNAKQVSANSTSAYGLSGSEDRATLSSDTQSLSSLVATALSSPETRDDQVASLQQSIGNGTYQIDPNAIAGSMIDEHA